MLSKSLPRVASSTYVPCTKCERSGSYCRVIAHTNATTAKTQCEICGKTKTLKLEAAKAPRKMTSKKSPPKSSEKQFEALLEEFGTTGTPYSIRESYTKNTVIDHPKFGRGVVTEARTDRVEVLFRDGLRDLIQNRK